MILRLLLSFSLALPAWALAATHAPDETVALDRILVVVNDDVITQTELNERLPIVKRQLAAQRIRLPDDTVLKRQLLERMILERIQLQAAKQAGIAIADDKIEQAIDRLAQQSKLSRAEFVAGLAREGVPPAKLKEQIRSQLMIERLLEREINNRVVVSEAEIEDYLAEREKHGEDVQFNVSHIVIRIPEAGGSAAAQAAKARAEVIAEKLRDGADFEQTAVAESHDQKALEGGNLGWRSGAQLPRLFVQTLEAMKPGDISPILRSANGFHILKLNDKRGGETPHKVTQTHARHILIKPNEVVTPENAARKIQQLRERIEHGADFAELAKAHSDDPGSAAAGGDLGWLMPAQTVPEFEREMNALAPNQLSQPVRTRFGVHLIQVLARREQDVTQQLQHNQARAQIHARKADERYEQWLRQLRDEAFVEYRVEVN